MLDFSCESYVDDSHEISSIKWFLKEITIFKNVYCCKFKVIFYVLSL